WYSPMRRAALLALVLHSGTVAADDLTVLKSAKGETPPRKLLHAYLIAECDKHFTARRAEVEKLKTPADVAARQKALREKFVEALGGFPEKAPLNAKTVGTLKRDGYTIEKVIYESRPDHHVTANLYLPDGKGPFPGVLMPLGHSQNGKAADYMQRGAILLAKNGIAALVYDPIGQGERSQLLDKLGNPAIKGSTSEHTMVGVGALLVGRSTASYRVWDGIRSLDYLSSRPEIDAKKLGCSGCSGGGTLTSYLMALDDRILAAAPSCYLTSLERLFATIGPQDAEQNITGQVAFGLDHADYIFLRAPKPTLIVASTRDFFDIQGTWATFREAKRIYTLLGVPERVDMIKADAQHGYPKSHREAMARFMSRWLKGEDKVITEGDWPIEKDAALQCTRSGQVLDDLRGKSVFDLNAALATEFAKKRVGRPLKPDELRGAVQQLVLPDAVPVFTTTEMGTVEKDRFTIHKRLFHTGSGVPVPALVYEPKGEIPAAPLVVYVHDLGAAASTEPVAKLAGGRRTMAVDLPGYGETAPAVAKDGKGPAFGVEVKESFLALHLNRPLLGQRTAGLLGVINTAPKEKGVDLIGVGSAGPVVLHAAMMSDRVRSVTIDGGLISWENVVRTPISHNQFANVVPGALKVYDLSDLAAALAPRPLTIRNPVDAAGKPLTKEAAEEAYRGVRAAYKQAKAEDKFTLIVDAK
ncbi:MAG: acetylxylan esterase, partial [Planctomycetes bacterium]|nr:acetylxylan esterase [Planctomycetota bacterium]